MKFNLRLVTSKCTYVPSITYTDAINITNTGINKYFNNREYHKTTDSETEIERKKQSNR